MAEWHMVTRLRDWETAFEPSTIGGIEVKVIPQDGCIGFLEVFGTRAEADAADSHLRGGHSGAVHLVA